MKGLRTAAIAAVATACLGSAGAVNAKGLGPGDTRVCDEGGCEPIMRRGAIRDLASFLYAGPRPERAATPALGSRSFEIRLRQGRVVGTVAGRWLSRIRVPTLNCGRFRGRRWYRLPPELAHEVRRLTDGRPGVPLGPPPRRTC